MVEKPSEEQALEAAYFLAASKRLKRDFLKEDDASISKVLSTLSEDDVRSFGLDASISDINSLIELGIYENVSRMSSIWADSRTIRG